MEIKIIKFNTSHKASENQIKSDLERKLNGNICKGVLS